MNKYDEAMETWEQCIVLAYQVFGKNYHVYKTMKDSHLWAVYQKKDNMLFRIEDVFIQKSEDFYKMEDYQAS